MEQYINAAEALYHKIDGHVAPFVFSSIEKYGGIKLVPNPTTGAWPFVSSPTPLLLSLAAYFTIVILGLLINKATGAKKRDPVILKPFVALHNVGLVVLSTYMFVKILLEAKNNGYSVWGNAYKRSEKEMAIGITIFFLSKIWEFVDTFIMLLKGNVRQVSFLHVYHHASISAIWWMLAYDMPGGEVYWSATLNSFVHIVMYSYYLLASIITGEGARKKYLFWGKYLTQLQMTQFLLNLFQAYYNMQSATSDAHTKFFAKVLFYYMGTMLFLFGQFYIQKWIKGSPSAHKDKKHKTN
eukprot:jgi/Mesvir1/15373/Mv06569-RA.1